MVRVEVSVLLRYSLPSSYGAEVTAVDSTAKLDMLRSIGADQVIDYTQEDFTKNGEIYDVIFDVVGTISFSRSARSIKQNGTYLLANPLRSQMVRGPWTRMTSSKRSNYADIKPNNCRFNFPQEGLLRRGRLKRSSIEPIRWNKSPRHTGMLKQGARREI